MGVRIDGKVIAEERLTALRERVGSLSGKPGLAVILVGDDPASHLYVELKEKAARRVGMHFTKIELPTHTSEHHLIDLLTELNADQTIHGIVVQLPLPPPLEEGRIIRAIDPVKDADGFHPKNVERFLNGEPRRTPALIRAILTLLDAAGANLERAAVAVIARESVFTRCLRHLLEAKGAQVSVHPPMNAFGELTVKADILIVAAGKPRFINAHQVKPGAVVIDIGITKLPEGTVVGDVDTDAVAAVARAITPVPGGVGPVTVVSLLENVVEAYQTMQNSK